MKADASASKHKPISQRPQICVGAPLTMAVAAAAAVASVQARRDVEDIRMEPPSPPLTPPTLQSPLVPLRHVIV